ncbi:transcriptional regulator [Kineococcus radiotolerans]|uniref:Winged helix DNA-binding domain-containing protein n=1 Tax=Kineococcus radiotolerans (strain ATCC BAA-149 / DSM 14245 / SRS30216) TaxID=266940 RepID=A6WFD9_KINRD|nr:transcriptional regulator [Kineococcus radiotolerans]ABS05528.1 hypothetical protein Krad_4065 [Kineococcus radiotolerans SRS30216 = ATCC BAA-149]
MTTAPDAQPAAAAATPSGAGGAAIDEFLHTPARLNICSLLAPADWVTFSFLRDTIGTSDSALSKQVAALEQVGYVEVRKERAVQALRRQTSVRLTAAGRDAFEAYLATLELLVARARGDR